MIFLPIVERELRVAARRRGTYWNRAVSALVAILVCGWLFLVSARDPIREIGKLLFSILSGLFFFSGLMAGIRFTADTLSEEKREGTLGLLFLTDLRGYDVVLGKLAATSVNAFYGLLAIFPVMAIPLLLGGVSGAEFWRMTLVLTNSLFFSLSAGIALSSVSRSARKAMTGTFLLVLLINGVSPALGAYVAHVKNSNAVSEWFLVPSAGYAYVLAFDAMYRTRSELFATSVAVTHAMSWVFLLLASVAARRSWQDKPAGARKVRFRERWQQWSYGNAAQRKAFRTRLLNASPCYWLSGRQRLKPALVWAFVGLMGCLWVWGFLKWRDDWASDATYVVTAIILHTSLKLWVASEACQKLGPDYRSGALELLLSTPLTVREILRGQLLSLRRQFLWPVVFVVFIDFAFMAAGVGGSGGPDTTFWIWLWLAGISVFVADVYTLGWVGLWVGLTAKHANRATSATVGRVLVLPWFIWAVVLMGMSFLNLWNRFPYESGFILGLWFGASVAADLFFFLWSQYRLHHDLRDLATLRFVAGRPLFWRWPSSRRAPAAPAPAPAAQ
jgi:ABC-type transport system involved in cytochrome c biogenesis permease component